MMAHDEPRTFADNFDKVFQLTENGHPRPGVVATIFAGDLLASNAVRHAGVFAVPKASDRQVLTIFAEEEAIGVLNTRQVPTGVDLALRLEKFASEATERLKCLRGEIDGTERAQRLRDDLR